MKRVSIFAKALMGAAVVTMAFGTVSCKNENKPEDPKEVAEDQNEAKFDDTNDAKEDDSEYFVFAATMDMKEVELGKLAQTKSANTEVKAYAKMLEEMHSKALADLKTTAAAKNISIPEAMPEKGQEAYADLNDKSGVDFDKAYIDKMIDGHEKAIEKMEKASEKAADADIRTWAANMLPTLRTHLDKAKAIKETLK
ncbi:MAG: DUF4142 domain-containing protein [Flavobacterium sp.]